MKRYKANLKIENGKVISYRTHVATINGNELIKEKWEVGGRTSSPTTTKHINYVASEYDLNIVEAS